MPCLLTGQAKLASVPSGGGGGGGAAAPAGGADAGGKSKFTAFYSTGCTQCCPASSMHGRPCLKLTYVTRSTEMRNKSGHVKSGKSTSKSIGDGFALKYWLSCLREF